MHGNFVNQLSRKYDSFRQFQLVQTGIDRAELRLVLCEQGRPEEIDAFRQDVADFLPGVAVRAVVVPGIAPGKSGKFRYSIRQFDLHA